MNILIVDDQRSARRALSAILLSCGIDDLEIREAGSLAEATQAVQERPFDCALVDIRLADDPRNRDGIELVQRLRETTTTVPIVVTVSNEMHEIRAAMRSGAFDYILKDDLCEELVGPIIRGVASQRRLEREVVNLRARQRPSAMQGVVGSSDAMRRLQEAIRRVAASDRPVLVTGPTGAGKELVARAIHVLGSHPDEPLIDLNCGAIPETLMESQLFGHERGAFTGADRRQDGCLSQVRRGTLFLDEIAELPHPLQAKLLRVLETRKFRRLGGTEELSFQGRVVAATHQDLEARARAGRFREDLWFRLGVLVVRVPALDERREDIPELVAHFVKAQTRPLHFSEEALRALMVSAWPGNVRELRNLIDRLTVFAPDDLVDVAALAEIQGQSRADAAGLPSLSALAEAVLALPLPHRLDAVERALILAAMGKASGNKSEAARLLGVHRKVIERRLDRMGEPGSSSDGETD
jgi:DNA-binding NtrC family response regulator